MIRGGDTPEKTLWKHTTESVNTYTYCETRGQDILILPKNRSGAAPIVNNGVIVAFAQIPESAFVGWFVNPLNARGFNLPTSGWLEELTTLNVGDPVTNWNEYQEL